MAPQAQPAAPVAYPRHTHAWWMMLIAAALFIIAAFAFGGESLGDVPAWSWAMGAFAAWMLASVV